jgi:hypothetical protein
MLERGNGQAGKMIVDCYLRSKGDFLHRRRDE